MKTLKGLTPYETICKAWTKEPERFRLDPIHQMPGLNTYAGEKASFLTSIRIVSAQAMGSLLVDRADGMAGRAHIETDNVLDLAAKAGSLDVLKVRIR
jgi:hypothetical protein